MKPRNAGDLLTAQDVEELVEMQGCLDRLPWGLRKYYLLKAGYFALRTRILGVIIAAGIVALGVLSYLRRQDLIVAVLLVIVGVLVGFVIAWEIENGDNSES